MSPSTLHEIRATLRAALNAAVREGLLASNPAAILELPPHPRAHAVVWTPSRVRAWRAGAARPPVAVWTPADTARFLQAIEGEELYPLLRLVAVCGLRRGEAVGLCWPDLDLEAGTVTVARTLHEQRGRQVLLPPKTAAGARTLALDRTTIAVLTAHHHRQRERAGVDRPAGFVFARPDGQPYSPGWVTHRFTALQREHDLPPVRLHDLRHGAATLALASGADLKAIQAMLGHASIVMTADTYTSVLPEVARATVDGIAQLIQKAGRVPPGVDPRAAGRRSHPRLTTASPPGRK